MDQPEQRIGTEVYPLKQTVSLSPEPAGGQTQIKTNPFLIPLTGRNLTVLAWVVTVLISTLPSIVLIELSGSSPSWLPFAQMGFLVVLVFTTFVWKPVRPLRNFFLVMLAFLGLMELRPHINFTWVPLQTVLGRNIFDGRMQAEQTGKLAVALIMIGMMLVLGYKRRDFFLTRGHLHAPIEPVPLLGFPNPDPWPRFGLQWGFYIAAALAIVQYLILRPDGDLMLKAVPILPSIIFYAALNAFNEEITYRSPMLATLESTSGSKQAMWLAAYFFGIAHYFGTPGGLLGGVLAIFMGWILGKGMVETRGFFWTWWIHFLSDIVIFIFLAATLLQ